MRAFVATEQLLVVASAEGEALAPYPDGPIEGAHVAVDGAGVAWIVGLVRSAPVPTVKLLAHEGAGGFATVATLDLAAAPVLPLVERAYVAPAQGGAVVVLAGAGAAWASRWDGAAFGPIERLTPLGGDALVGAPAVDAAGRFALPFAFTPRDALDPLMGALVPRTRSTSLHYLAMNSDGSWSSYGGAVVSQGVGAPPALELRPDVAAFLYVDRSARLHRIETWDSGTSWGAPAGWSEGREVRGVPAAARETYASRATAAWWEDGDGTGQLVVARAEGGPKPIARERVVDLEDARDAAALALLSDGRALVAWVDGRGSVWLAVEGGELPRAECGEGDHCARPYPR